MTPDAIVFALAKARTKARADRDEGRHSAVVADDMQLAPVAADDAARRSFLAKVPQPSFLQTPECSPRRCDDALRWSQKWSQIPRYTQGREGTSRDEDLDSRIREGTQGR